MWIRTLKVDRVSERGHKKSTDRIICDSLFEVFLNDTKVASFNGISTQIESFGLGYLILMGRVSFDETCIFQKQEGSKLFYEGQMVENNSWLPPDAKSQYQISDLQIIHLGSFFQEKAFLFKDTAVTESAALCSPKGIDYFAEDLKGENAICKILGQAATEKQSLSNFCLYVSFRIDLDWLQKLISLGIRLVISRVAPTQSAYEYARMHGVRLIGFARQKKFTVYK